MSNTHGRRGRDKRRLDVRPILRQHCFHCHAELTEMPGGLDLRTVKQMLVGGDSGPAVVSGSAAESELWKPVASPHYGERWARHWLENAGFSETDGNAGEEIPRPYARRLQSPGAFREST